MLYEHVGMLRLDTVRFASRIEVAKLRPGHVRAVLARMQQRGLSPATIAQARGVLSSALRQAVDDGLAPNNPVAIVKRPRIRRAEPHWPTPVQLAALLAASRNTLWEVPVLLATVTGARRSEVLGVSWEDVDLATGSISIRRGVQRVPRAEGGGGVMFTPLKTKRAHRLVHFLPSPSRGSANTGDSSLSAAARVGQSGMTLLMTAGSRCLWFANAAMVSFYTRTRSRMHSSNWHALQDSIPPPACTTCVTRSRPSSGAEEYMQ